MKENKEEQFYTVKTVCDLIPWKPNERAVSELARKGMIPHTRIGRRYVFKHSEIINWLSGQTDSK